jgi:hypothetical protein
MGELIDLFPPLPKVAKPVNDNEKPAEKAA